MILYPAIDLKDGQCVRLLHGDMEKATVFNTSPADQAQRFVKDGFSWLHSLTCHVAQGVAFHRTEWWVKPSQWPRSGILRAARDRLTGGLL